MHGITLYAFYECLEMVPGFILLARRSAAEVGEIFMNYIEFCGTTGVGKSTLIEGVKECGAVDGVFEEKIFEARKKLTLADKRKAREQFLKSNQMFIKSLLAAHAGCSDKLDVVWNRLLLIERSVKLHSEASMCFGKGSQSLFFDEHFAQRGFSLAFSGCGKYELGNYFVTV